MNTSTRKDDSDEFFEKLAREADALPPRPNHPSVTLEGNDALDSYLLKQNSRPFYRKTIGQQLENSTYVWRYGYEVTDGKNVNRYDVREAECIIRELKSDGGHLEGFITRARAGFEVLHTPTMMFVDVDFDSESGVPGKAQTSSTVAKATEFARANNWTVRIYRTHSGLRLIITHSAYESVDESFDAVCAAVGADPLFQELCHQQSCFLGRLTPKPERCDIVSPEHVFPFMDDDKEEYFAGWLEAYSTESARYGTCRYIGTVGTEIILPRLLPLVTLHDDFTKAHSDLPIR